MHAKAEPQASTRFQDASSLGHIENVRLTEHVAVTSQFRLCHQWQHFLDNHVDVSYRVACELLWNLMRAQEGRYAAQRRCLSGFFDNAQNLKLISGGQPIAGFRFNGCGSV